VVAVGLVVTLVTGGGYRFGIITSFIFTIAALSLVVLTGLIGQISLAQAALAGAGGFILSGLSHGLHIPFPISTVLAALAAAGFGIIVGLPALRIRGAQLAVVTLAAGLALEQFVFDNPSFSSASGAVVPNPRLFGLNLAVQKGYDTARWQFAVLVLIIVTLVALAVGNLIRSDTGKAFLAIRSNERASAAAGIGVTSNKLLAFGFASFLAGLCGALIGYSRGQISGDSFSSTMGITFLVFAYLGGITSISGAVIAGTLVPLGIGYVIINRLFPHLGNYYLLISSVGLIVTAIFNPEGISRVLASQAATVRSWLTRPFRSGQRFPVTPSLRTAQVTHNGSKALKAPKAPTRQVPLPLSPAGLIPRTASPALMVEGLTVEYGGLRAVDNLSLEVAAGEIVGLIGPNGAGKTSLVDAVTGFTEAEGRVIVCGDDLAGRHPHERARSGLSRTWQSVELFRDLTIRDNIAVSTSRPGLLGTLKDLVWPRSRASAEALWSASLLGVEDYLDMQPGDLSLGQQKLVGVSRALAPRPAVVILDEPAAGLDSTETTALGCQIATIADLGIAVLLIDHDMDLVLQVCHRVYVIDFGRLIATGSPEDIRNNPEVIAAYLGGAPGTEVEAGASESGTIR
jgi:ABC-type branched-subunit amino acid transport system ATPase component/ABC-type branched-subunit amino acid transport system permease subunit